MVRLGWAAFLAVISVGVALAPSPAGGGASPVPAGTGTGLSQYAKPSDKAEGFAAYVPQSSCNPRWLKGVRIFRDLVMKTYPATEDWGSERNCTDDGISEHLDGRAWDWHADVNDPKQFAAATDLLNWLMAKGPDGQPAYWARRLGIMYIGYNHKIWGSYRASEGWRPLNNSNPHTDHVHFSFSWAGAFGRTSFHDGTVASEDYGPCRPYQNEPAPLYTRKDRNRRACGTPPALGQTTGASGTRLWRGSRGSEVSAVQRALGVTTSKGFFDRVTMQAVAGYQVQKQLPRTGAVDSVTRRSFTQDGVLGR